MLPLRKGPKHFLQSGFQLAATDLKGGQGRGWAGWGVVWCRDLHGVMVTDLTRDHSNGPRRVVREIGKEHPSCARQSCQTTDLSHQHQYTNTRSLRVLVRDGINDWKKPMEPVQSTFKRCPDSDNEGTNRFLGCWVWCFGELVAPRMQTVSQQVRKKREHVKNQVQSELLTRIEYLR